MPCRSRHMGNYRNMARGENGYYPQIVRVGSHPLAAIQPLQEQTPLRRIRSHPREYSELYSVTPGEFFFASDHIDEEFRSLIQLAARSVFAIMAENDSHTFSASSEQLHHNQRNLQQFATVSFFIFYSKNGINYRIYTVKWLGRQDFPASPRHRHSILPLLLLLSSLQPPTTIHKPLSANRLLLHLIRECYQPRWTRPV